jgi:hypothetical protein
MERPAIEVADIFRRYGTAYREVHAASLSQAQRRVMRAIEQCRTAALGGHVEQCSRCAHRRIAYNSCAARNRAASAHQVGPPRLDRPSTDRSPPVLLLQIPLLAKQSP